MHPSSLRRFLALRGLAPALLVSLLSFSGAALAQSKEANLFRNTDPAPRGLSIQNVSLCDPKPCKEILVARGDFTADSGEKLSQVLEKLQRQGGAQPVDLYLDSPGGVLTGALGFGAVVRVAGLNTVVGPKMTCFSACAYAFLGGVSRTLEEGSKYGVHRFFATKDVEGGVEMSQQTMAILSSFVENMGASANLVRLSASAGQRSMVVLSMDQARELRVDNTFPVPQPWSIQTRNDTLDMLVTQHSAFNDRLVTLILRPQGKKAVLEVAFQEPKAYSKTNNRVQTAQTPHLTLCRVNLRSREVRKCLDGELISSWKPSTTERSFTSTFSFSLKDIGQLLEGNSAERLVVAVTPQGKQQPMIVLATSTEGFGTAYRVVASSR